MKKLLLTSCIFLFLIKVFAQTSTGISLNGYPFALAQKMVSNFKTTAAVAQQKTNVWFSSDVIMAMSNLLSKETGPKGEPIDGVRIYFAMDNNMQKTVVLVSTYRIVLPHADTIHEDYFYHNKKDALFTTPGVNGKANNQEDMGTARLYDTCGPHCADDSCKGSAIPHYITRYYSETMVHAFNDITIPVAKEDTTKSEWFPLCFFSNFDPTKYDGMRLYFARHTALDLFYPKRFTFVIENTKTGPNGTHLDVFDCKIKQCATANDRLNGFINRIIASEKVHPNSVLKKAVPMKNARQIRLSRLSLQAFFANGGFDEGELCPLNCAGDSLQ